MTLKKINPEELVVGREYYVKLKLFETDESSFTFGFKDLRGGEFWHSDDQPIYTYEADQPIIATLEQTADTELEMLVNVASRLWETKPYSTWNDCIKEAKEFITVCKNALKEGER